jgi:hypothetical protein
MIYNSSINCLMIVLTVIWLLIVVESVKNSIQLITSKIVLNLQEPVLKVSLFFIEFCMLAA